MRYFLVFFLLSILIKPINSQTILTEDHLSFRRWQKNQNILKKVSDFNNGLTKDTLSLNDTFYVSKNFSYENIYARLASYYTRRNQKNELYQMLILATRNGFNPDKINAKDISFISNETLVKEYKKYLNLMDTVLDIKIADMIAKDQNVRREEPIDGDKMRTIDSLNQMGLKEIINKLKRWPGNDLIGKLNDPSLIVMHTIKDTDVVLFLKYIIESCQQGYSTWNNAISILSHRTLRVRTYEDGSKSFLFINQDEDLEELEIYSIAYILTKVPKLKISFSVTENALGNRILEKLILNGISKQRISITNNSNFNSYNVFI